MVGSFHMNGYPSGILHKRTALYSMTNSLHHIKVLLSGFHLNGHTLEFYPLTQELEPPCMVPVPKSHEKAL